MSTGTSLQSIPGELIIGIFKIVIESSGDHPPQPCVFVLSAISSFLRRLAIECPSLWTCIRIACLRDLSTAEIFIERSKECLLHVCVYLGSVDFIPVQLMRGLHISRWRKLAVTARYPLEITNFIKTFSDLAAPQLEDVELLAKERWGCNDVDHTRILGGASSSLRSLRIQGCTRCLAPFPFLTKLHIHSYSCKYADLRELIDAFPNLSTLIISRYDDLPDAEPTTPQAPIESSSLRFLAVNVANDIIFPPHLGPPPFSFLFLPNLEYLELTGNVDYGMFTGTMFPSVRTLCLRSISITPSFALFCCSLSLLTRLELIDVDGASMLTNDKEGSPSPSQTLLWPDLQTLVFWPSESSWDHWLGKLLHSRRPITIEVPEEYKSLVLQVASIYALRCLSEAPIGLLDMDGMEEDEVRSYFSESDYYDYFSDASDYDAYSHEEDYYEDDDDGLDGVDGWSP